MREGVVECIHNLHVEGLVHLCMSLVGALLLVYFLPLLPGTSTCTLVQHLVQHLSTVPLGGGSCVRCTTYHVCLDTVFDHLLGHKNTTRHVVHRPTHAIDQAIPCHGTARVNLPVPGCKFIRTQFQHF